jgi:hypothetical protein
MTMLMRGGRHVAPAIVLDTTESQWVKDGADLGMQHGARDDLWKTCATMGQAHVDFDLIPYAVFADARRTTFDKTMIRIGKEDYRAVILPGVESIPAAAIERLREFYEAGGIVVALNGLPAKSCDGRQDERVRSAAEQIWGTTASKRGKSAVATYDSLGRTLAALNVPDVLISPQFKNLLYYHRQLHSKHLYFFANTAADPVAATIELRGVRGVPMLWDSVTGAISRASDYSNENDGLRLKLELGEYESTFLVVEPNVGPNEPASTPSAFLPKQLTLQGTWQVSKGVDEHHRLFATEVQLPADWPIGSPALLELKGASEILRIEVNGRAVGRRFCSPYRFEVGKELRAGDNRILVERVGRIALPNAVVPASMTANDAAAKVPCTQATLATHSEHGPAPENRGHGQQ